MIDAAHPVIEQAIVDEQRISDGVFEELREIPIDVSEYDGTGPHSAQFLAWQWRFREDGSVFTHPPLVLSVPVVVEVDRDGFCLLPRDYEDSGCRITTLLLPAIPPLNAEEPPPQHRSMGTYATYPETARYPPRNAASTAL